MKRARLDRALASKWVAARAIDPSIMARVLRLDIPGYLPAQAHRVAGDTACERLTAKQPGEKFYP
ncbi:hypothetical protein [Novosphingobium sp. CF614]|uniref:hypothetical protein n=1 Tax=Novosphingobium sp. CF614 TaxID=1884364 RepID=UPI000B8681BC|nr:hypothetical protein [Novosphingobium sp. CF614]